MVILARKTIRFRKHQRVALAILFTVTKRGGLVTDSRVPDATRTKFLIISRGWGRGCDPLPQDVRYFPLNSLIYSVCSGFRFLAKNVFHSPGKSFGRLPPALHLPVIENRHL